MKKLRHEIRDPIHNFVRLDNTERKIVDSEPFQRLRHIHQLAMSYLVYPDATHKRFEHSLGVMELAGKGLTVLRMLIIGILILPNDLMTNWKNVIIGKEP